MLKTAESQLSFYWPQVVGWMCVEYKYKKTTATTNNTKILHIELQIIQHLLSIKFQLIYYNFNELQFIN